MPNRLKDQWSEPFHNTLLLTQTLGLHKDSFRVASGHRCHQDSIGESSNRSSLRQPSSRVESLDHPAVSMSRHDSDQLLVPFARLSRIPRSYHLGEMSGRERSSNQVFQEPISLPPDISRWH